MVKLKVQQVVFGLSSSKYMVGHIELVIWVSLITFPINPFFRSEESTPPPSPVVFFSAEEYHNDSAKISTSFISVSLSTLAILFISFFYRHF